MRTTCTALVVLVLLAAVSAQQVISDFGEYQRKKAEYDAQKAKYDEFQSLKNVPLLASYDLIPKVKDAQAPAGNAEQLLPTYTGIPINFNEATGAGAGRGVEPGNTPQNYFHTGPIPAKKSAPEPPPKPVVIPTGPGQDFVVPQSDDAAVAAPAAPSFSSGADAAPIASFAAPTAPTPAPAAVAPAASGQALFFGRGALPVTTATSFAPAPAAAPIQASTSLSAFAGTSAAPLRALGKQFQLGPYLPHSDFHPGPIRAVPVLPEHLREDVIPHAPVPLFARETFFAHDFPSAASFGGQPARTYGPPGI